MYVYGFEVKAVTLTIEQGTLLCLLWLRMDASYYLSIYLGFYNQLLGGGGW